MPSFSTVSTGRYSDDTQQARAIVEVYRERVFMDAQLFAEKAARYGPWGDAIADEDVCGIPGTAGPIALFAIRCWLRSPHAWLPRVLDAISAGGDTDTAAAVTGGLLGHRPQLAGRLVPEQLDGLAEGLRQVLADAERVLVRALGEAVEHRRGLGWRQAVAVEQDGGRLDRWCVAPVEDLRPREAQDTVQEPLQAVDQQPDCLPVMRGRLDVQAMATCRFGLAPPVDVTFDAWNPPP